MKEYGADRAWSDRYLPAIRQIVGPRLLVPSPEMIDQTQAADLIVLKARDMTIAARIRRPGFFEKWPFDFTIRSQRDSGATTELSKIIDGFGDWMLYGHADQGDDAKIAHWMLLDLATFRSWLMCDGTYARKQLKMQTTNRDGTHFVAFDVRRYNGSRRPLIIASNFEIPRPKTFSDPIDSRKRSVTMRAS